MTSKAQKKHRRIVAMDETKLKVNGAQLFVWSAIDTDTKELLAVYASYQRSSINAMVFVKMVLETCTNKPVVLVDGGPWYPWALERYGLKWLHITFGERNSIERYFRTLKERTKRFCNNINSRVEGIQSLTVFLNLFMLYYNHLRWHQGVKAIPGGGLI
jgi:transposase-like protein